MSMKFGFSAATHRDCGGGYYHDGISDAVLKCMKMEATEAGLKCCEITKETCKRDHDTLICCPIVAKQNNVGHLSLNQRAPLHC